ncbi:hypothetical protein [Myxacorys almedinensis]|uniref:Uncharacterized protein n=1 Tax=Myxacorys almedinensis A TaxID=2690445 RepID=A0A8J7Z3J0_9CYAN|nr:hypothetical protein [Myxacorys almedinensis]NDJ19752.1 hypothetical protein [Myxacorys almedinensis A]
MALKIKKFVQLLGLWSASGTLHINYRVAIALPSIVLMISAIAASVVMTVCADS